MRLLHTTAMGTKRVKRNLGLDVDDVVEWCKSRILLHEAKIERRGKNWYVRVEDCVLTINAHSFTIITAHKRSCREVISGNVTVTLEK